MNTIQQKKKKVNHKFKSKFEEWDNGKDQIDFYLGNCQTIGKSVKAIKPDGEVSGKAVAINTNGALVLDSGEEITVGDLIHLKG